MAIGSWSSQKSLLSFYRAESPLLLKKAIDMNPSRTLLIYGCSRSRAIAQLACNHRTIRPTASSTLQGFVIYVGSEGGAGANLYWERQRSAADKAPFVVPGNVPSSVVYANLGTSRSCIRPNR